MTKILINLMQDGHVPSSEAMHLLCPRIYFGWSTRMGASVAVASSGHWGCTWPGALYLVAVYALSPGDLPVDIDGFEVMPHLGPEPFRVLT
jgi:hypothetical protein